MALQLFFVHMLVTFLPPALVASLNLNVNVLSKTRGTSLNSLSDRSSSQPCSQFRRLRSYEDIAMEPPVRSIIKLAHTYPGSCSRPNHPSKESRPIHDDEYLIRVFVKMRRELSLGKDISISLYSVYNQIIYNTKYKLPLPCSPMNTQNLRSMLFNLAKEDNLKRADMKQDFTKMKVICHMMEGELFYYDLNTRRMISYDEFQKRYNELLSKSKVKAKGSQSLKLPQMSSSMLAKITPPRLSKSTK